MLLCNEYTPAQWQWIWERYCEGYSIKELLFLSIFLKEDKFVSCFGDDIANSANSSCCERFFCGY